MTLGAAAPRRGRRTARGPVLLLLIACLTAVIVGAVIEGWFWLTLVALALSLVAGALAVTTIRPRRRRSGSLTSSGLVGRGQPAGSRQPPSR